MGKPKVRWASHIECMHAARRTSHVEWVVWVVWAVWVVWWYSGMVVWWVSDSVDGTVVWWYDGTVAQWVMMGGMMVLVWWWCVMRRINANPRCVDRCAP